MKDFYIVPTAKTYYDKVSAENKEEALVSFADSMDMNMAAYFDAIENPDFLEKEPKNQIHTYEYPDGDYQVAMAIIADTLAGNKKSAYYNDEALKDISLDKIDALIALQKVSDAITNNKSKRSWFFFNILCELTGFAFDKGCDDDSIYRILVKENVEDALSLLDNRGIKYDEDEGGRFIIQPAYIDEVMDILEDAGFDVDLI